MAVTATEASIKENVVKFIKSMRDDEGRYVQAVISDYNQANFEGIISNKNTISVNGVAFTKEEITALLAGILAGTPVSNTAVKNASNTNFTIRGADKIIGELTNNEIIESLKRGFIVFAANQNGDIKIEQDINTLQTFTLEKIIISVKTELSAH